MPKGDHQHADHRPRLTQDQIDRFLYLVFDQKGPRLSIARAAKETSIGRTRAYELAGETKRPKPKPKADGGRFRIPDPIPFESLSDDAKRALEDFAFFRMRYFARRTDPAGVQLALLILEALTSPEKEFVDINLFPGAGKTTMLHDIEAWLIAGGGVMDPALGRAIRMMLGSEVRRNAQHMVARLRRSLELQRPFWDKDQRVYAEGVMAVDFGRFRPDVAAGEESLWTKDEFIVAQMEEVDLYEKEPTVQAASYESGFLGERVNLGVWDDISTTRNSRTPEMQGTIGGWFEDEAETRVEPGGALILVGQRLGPYDLHRHRLDATYTDEDDGVEKPLYKHFVLPAHWDTLCEGEHRQWNGILPGEDGAAGCLTNEWRFSGRDFVRLRGKANFETVYQQSDVDPGRTLVQHAWLDGTPDADGYVGPGCWNLERGFMEWPASPDGVVLVDYVTVDPSAGNFWAIEWWCVNPVTMRRYLIWGKRARMRAGDFLDWNNEEQKFEGLMHELTGKSFLLGHPIRVWIVEQNAAHRYLREFSHFIRWQQMFSNVVVIPHQTQTNKNDPELGIESVLPSAYRQGLKDLPKKPHDIDSFNYMKVKVKELTTYVTGQLTAVAKKRIGFDTVDADWMGEWNLRKVIEIGRRPLGKNLQNLEPEIAGLPAYLRKQGTQMHYGKEG